MLFDMETGRPPDSALRAEVAVIGAGLAGLLLARRLAERGIRTVLVEAGGARASSTVDPFLQAEIVGAPYLGAIEGRVRCLGGTSTIWGGALIPPVSAEFERVDASGRVLWPIDFAEVQRYFAPLERCFSVASGPYDEPDAVAMVGQRSCVGSFTPRFAKWPRFRNRNLALLYADAIRSDKSLSVLLNAAVVGAEFRRDTREVAVLAVRSPGGREALIDAKVFVVCAGAIESTRILQEAFAKADWDVESGRSAVGDGFHNHFSISLGHVESPELTQLNRLAGFRFDGRTMRSLRFEFNPCFSHCAEEVYGFVHLPFEPLPQSGFEQVRDLLRAVQRGQLSWGLMRNAVFGSLGYLLPAAYWRVVERRLYWPRPSAIGIRFVIEQALSSHTRIGISSRRDPYGRNLPKIEWRFTDADTKALRIMAENFERYWLNSELRALGRIVWNKPLSDLNLEDFLQAEDIHHPCGSTRMSAQAKDGVVDPDLKVFGFSNLYTASTAVMPAVGAANPSMLLGLLCLRLADHLGVRLRGNSSEWSN